MLAAIPAFQHHQAFHRFCRGRLRVAQPLKPLLSAKVRIAQLTEGSPIPTETLPPIAGFRNPTIQVGTVLNLAADGAEEGNMVGHGREQCETHTGETAPRGPFGAARVASPSRDRGHILMLPRVSGIARPDHDASVDPGHNFRLALDFLALDFLNGSGPNGQFLNSIGKLQVLMLST